MRIVCIGWGSLLWKPGALQLSSPWQPGGPALPLEFARDSDDSDELALVITEGAALMPTFRAAMAATDLGTARAQLREREKVSNDHPEWIGSIPAPDGGREEPRIAAWLASQPFDAAVWTALPPKFGNVNGRVPGIAEALALLAAKQGDARQHAQDYVRCIPPSIMTAYRRQFEQQLGWTCISGL